MHRSNWPAIAGTLLLALLLVPLAHGASDAASPSDSKASDEVVIQATRADLVKLGKEVELAAQRFYQRYNELNTKREYAVHCYTEAHTGSRFTQTHCQPGYQNDAEHDAGRDFLLYFQNSKDGVPQGGPPAPSSLAIDAGRGDFQKHVMEVTRKNPDLQKLLDEHAELVKRFEDMFRKVNERK